MADVCSGHGQCTRTGKCQCDVNWVGINCELRCPVKDLSVEDDQTVCSGHGTCSEARVFSGYDATEEDSKRYYMVTEAYRQWHNECPDNDPIDYFVMPFEEFPGSVSIADIVGGPGAQKCLRTEPKQTIRAAKGSTAGALRLQVLDDEKALNAEMVGFVPACLHLMAGYVSPPILVRAQRNIERAGAFRGGLCEGRGAEDGCDVACDKFYGYRRRRDGSQSAAHQRCGNSGRLCRAVPRVVGLCVFSLP